jgi:hypothetical protein
MVFKYFRDLFDPKDLVNFFSHLLLMYFYVVVGHIPESITKTFGVARMLALAFKWHSTNSNRQSALLVNE